MYPSCEVRWFFPSAPEGIAGWFASKSMHFEAPGNPLRTDYYLLIANGENIGLKLREGNVEAKHLVRRAGEWSFPEVGAKGFAEHWMKWSFHLDEADNLSRQVIQEGIPEWIAVFKERLGFTYHFTETGGVREVPIHEWVPEGCQVELTRIRMFGKEYYTFGLEAFSRNGQLEENLREGAKNAFSALRRWCASIAFPVDKLSMGINRSMSYPVFLLNLSRE
ncbi:MAG: hypothetical protein KDD06_19450 [Phaeodactylibacter sp.]|nr:hypothetical protein [Phaeodactylibacter sp.]MCB9265919.1 hypothetical protein [Lewinellaceae bacterium]MCB9289725.1 hypothetical protein [Lewinellaceae bacterium]